MVSGFAANQFEDQFNQIRAQSDILQRLNGVQQPVTFPQFNTATFPQFNTATLPPFNFGNPFSNFQLPTAPMFDLTNQFADLQRRLNEQTKWITDMQNPRPQPIAPVKDEPVKIRFDLPAQEYTSAAPNPEVSNSGRHPFPNWPSFHEPSDRRAPYNPPIQTASPPARPPQQT